MKVRINILLKKNVLDIQGKAIESAIAKNLGIDKISNIRQGKLIEMEINEADPKKAEDIISKICNNLLVNKVIEEYSFSII